VYKKAHTAADTISELNECAGTQFDPRLIKAFVGVVEKVH
jgi:HD-GYP domain-containing protein (c-di-GMP phosphodiesterase class II)